MKTLKKYILVCLTFACVYTCDKNDDRLAVSSNNSDNKNALIESKVEDLLSKMTLEENL